MCKYEWEYNGRKYTETLNYSGNPPQSEERFFRKTAKYAKNKKNFGKMESEQKYVFLVLWLAVSLGITMLLMNAIKK